MDEDNVSAHEEAQKKKHTVHKKPEHKESNKIPSEKKSGGNATAWTLGSIAVLLAILLVVSLFTHGFAGTNGQTKKTLTPDEVKAKAISTVQGLVQGQTVTVTSVVDAGDVYAIALEVGGQKYNSYATKDGTLLFPSSVDMSGTAKPAATQTATPPQPTSVPKTDKPTVELFVMSYCPYGTQAEKGILPAVRTLGDKIDFKVRFVYYAMHGEKEVYENLAQYCIQKEQPQVYDKYLACFLNASDEAGCLVQAGVDTAKLNTCKTAADAEFNVTKNWNDKSSWLSGQFPIMNFDYALNQKYGVQGSPTLVINGAQSNAGRDSASFLAGICAAFNTPPAECNTQLSSTSPGPGFGYDSTSAATAAGCGV